MTEDSSESPYRKAHAHSARKPHKRQASAGADVKHKRSKPSRRRRGKPRAAHSEHTSHPTTRGAQLSTRAWLLKQYGPICAYCGEKFTARKMTLDHVAPRRGQSAYDRRDNLVLACQPCNIAKRDQSPLGFLLGLRSRAVNLAKYGAHLSHGLIEMARSLVPSHKVPSSGRSNIDYSKWGPGQSDDDDSPYKR